MTLRRLAVIGCALAAPAAAQPLQFSAVVRGELGYGTNPFLQSDVTGGAAYATITVSPRLERQTARSDTVLDGSYSRSQYFSDFGYTDSIAANVQRTDQLSQFLTSTASAGYASSNRASGATAQLTGGDPLNLGRRTRTVHGSEQLQWQPSSADRLTVGGQFEHLGYGRSKGDIPGALASSYTQYSANGGYDHTIDARTSVGAQVTVSWVQSRIYPDSRTIQPSITAKRQLNAVWTIDAHIGVVLQKSFGPLGSSNASLGFGANLCGVYPRTRICIGGEHSKAPSGYGGLRSDSDITASVTHTLTEHSRLDFSGSYYETRTDGATGVAPVGDSRALLLNGDYDRDLSRRLSGGFGASYQRRMIRDFGTAQAISGTVHLSAKLGRL